MDRRLALAFTACLAVTGHTAFITPLGFLPGGSGSATATDVSNSGNAAIGYSPGPNGFEAFLWTPLVGMQGLGDLPGGGFTSYANGVTADGAKVVGQATPSTTYGFQWTSGSGMSQINGIQGGTMTYSICNGVSDDGSVIVGVTNSLAFGIRATIWRNGGLGVIQDDLPTGSTFSEAMGVSGNGLYTCGWSATSTGNDGALWGPTGLVHLPDLAGGPTDARARAASDDGRTVVGRGWDANSNTAVRWVNFGTPQLLAPSTISSPGFNSEAMDCSANGGVIVGQAYFPQGGAFIWTLATGMLDLRQVLTAQGIDMTSWSIFSNAVGVSSDGATIVGNGIHNGVITGYFARIDLAQLAGSIRCNVALNDFAGVVIGQPIQVEVHQSGNPVETWTAPLDSASRIGVVTSRRGSMQIAVKGSHWLRSSSSSFTYSGGDVTLNFSLVNGDVDNDNEIGPGDFGALSSAFGATSGDSNWNAMADLDEDGEVGPSDFGILSANFGLAGD